MNDHRPEETQGRRQEFSRRLGILASTLSLHLSFADSAIAAGIRKSPVMEALEKGKGTYLGLRKISRKDPEAQQAIIDRALELAEERKASIMSTRDVSVAKEEYKVHEAPSKEEQDKEAYNQIQKSFGRIIDQTTIIRDRVKFLYVADKAMSVLEMLDGFAETVYSIEKDVHKMFPAVKPRRGHR